MAETVEEKLLRRRRESQQAATREAETPGGGSIVMPYQCPMCNTYCPILVQCSVCVEEGCGICIPGGENTPCLACDAQAEVASPPEFPEGVPTGEVPAEAEAELEALHDEWVGGEEQEND